MPRRPHRTLPLAALATLGLLNACRPNPPAGPPTPEELPARLAAFDAYVQAALDASGVPGMAVALVRRDAVLHLRGYGVRQAGSEAPVGPDTVFAVASVTKAFTALAAGLLAAEGRFAWDDRVVDRLPGFALHPDLPTAEVRVRDLLTHRLGHATFAGDLVWIGSRFDAEDVLRRLPAVAPAWGLRDRYGYSNLGYLAAGALCEAASGDDWTTLIRTRLLEPLGMTRTTDSVAALDTMDDVASPHTAVDGLPRPIPYLPVDNMRPAAGLNSTAADLARWVRMQLGDGTLDGRTVAPPEVVAETRVPVTAVPISARGRELLPERHLSAYGLGWYLWDYRGRLVVTHDGGLPGMFSVVGFLPEEDFGVVVLSNGESLVTRAVMLRAFDLLLGAEEKDWAARFLEAERAAEAESPPVEPPAEPLPPSTLPAEAFAGNYLHPLLGRAEVTPQDDGLRLRLADHGGLDGTLESDGGLVFTARWSAVMFGRSRVHFEAEEGRVVRLRFAVVPDFIDPVEYVFERAD